MKVQFCFFIPRCFVLFDIIVCIHDVKVVEKWVWGLYRRVRKSQARV
jgi:hypothetical protein